MLHHHFPYTTYQLRCQNLRIVHRIQNLPKYLHIFWGLGSHTPVCLKKANKKMEVFCSSPLWNMNFGRSKIDFILSFWSFRDMIWKDVSFLSVDKQFRLQLWASFHAKFGRKDKSFIQVTKCKKKIDASPISTFQQIKTIFFNLNCTHT